jgi:hypothetical protein
VVPSPLSGTELAFQDRWPVDLMRRVADFHEDIVEVILDNCDAINGEDYCDGIGLEPRTAVFPQYWGLGVVEAAIVRPWHSNLSVASVLGRGCQFPRVPTQPRERQSSDYEADGPGSAGLSETGGEADGPVAAGLSETDGITAAGPRSEADAPVADGLLETDGITAAGPHSEADEPVAAGLSETGGLTAAGPLDSPRSLRMAILEQVDAGVRRMAAGIDAERAGMRSAAADWLNGFPDDALDGLD